MDDPTNLRLGLPNPESIQSLIAGTHTRAESLTDDGTSLHSNDQAQLGDQLAATIRMACMLPQAAIRDGLAAISILVAQDRWGGLVAPWAVGRTMVEAASVLWWIHASNDPTVRLNRAITTHIATSSAEYRLNGRIFGRPTEVDPEEERRLAQLLTSRGFAPQRNSDGMVTHVGDDPFPLFHGPRVKALWDAAEKARPFGGDVLYSMLSAPSHAELHAIFRQMKIRRMVEVPEYSWIEPGTAQERMAESLLLVSLTMPMTLYAFERNARYYWTGLGDWEWWYHHVTQTCEGWRRMVIYPYPPNPPTLEGEDGDSSHRTN
jgi:hypothetical protein